MAAWKKVCLGLCVAVGLVGAVAALVLYLESAALTTPPRVTMRIALPDLAADVIFEALRSDQKPLDLPESDIRSFYKWVMANRFLKEKKMPWSLWALLADPQAETFRDLWGNELVYVFPPRRKDLFFELYSVGPNGEDEQGRGDDVTAEPFSSVLLYSSKFSKGLVDPDWIHAHLRELQRNPEDRKIIGVPLEKLRESHE
jgi:hypothetical protein